MNRKYMKLERIENEHPITRETDGQFLNILCNALVLALREKGVLNLMQYRYAAERLKERHKKERSL